MTTVTFSYLEYASGEQLLVLLRRYAKQAKGNDPAHRSLSAHQDLVAVALGFNNWSLLHKQIAPMGWFSVRNILSAALKNPTLGPFVKKHGVRTIVVEDAVEKMQSWARKTYTPLVEFAYHDNESPTGYGWPDVDMAEELSNEFLGQYPEELIQEVGNDLDADEGPWGLEDYGRD